MSSASAKKKSGLIGIEKQGLVGVEKAPVPDLDINDKYREEVIQGLQEFRTDDSYFDQYRPFTIKDDHILVRLFRFIPKKAEVSVVLWGRDQAGNIVPVNEAYQSSVLPVGVVIRSRAEKYSAGDIVTFNYNEITPIVSTRAYKQWKEHTVTKGMTPKFDEERMRKVPAVQENWGQYMFCMPWNIEPTDEDVLTYSIPPAKVKSRWEDVQN